MLPPLFNIVETMFGLLKEGNRFNLFKSVAVIKAFPTVRAKPKLSILAILATLFL